MAEKTEAAIEASLKRAARLRQSILKKAFRGELAPQDPSDEPASALLERIRAEPCRGPARGRPGAWEAGGGPGRTPQFRRS